MVTALVLLNVSRDRVNEVAEELAEMKGISEVYSVAGRYDLAVVIRARDNDQLADLVTLHMLKVKGILASETLIAFRAFAPRPRGYVLHRNVINSGFAAEAQRTQRKAGEDQISSSLSCEQDVIIDLSPLC
jgi:uncharacterized protein with GYD domain